MTLTKIIIKHIIDTLKEYKEVIYGIMVITLLLLAFYGFAYGMCIINNT